VKYAKHSMKWTVHRFIGQLLLRHFTWEQFVDLITTPDDEFGKLDQDLEPLSETIEQAVARLGGWGGFKNETEFAHLQTELKSVRDQLAETEARHLAALEKLGTLNRLMQRNVDGCNSVPSRLEGIAISMQKDATTLRRILEWEETANDA